jgi:uncharacterized protein (DUF305 family)
MRRQITLLLATLIVFLGLATPAAAAPPPLPGMEEMMAQMEQDTAELRGLAGKDFEVAYMQKMRGHHLAAIEMAQLVPSRATHPELKTFARQVITDQQKEVAQLEGWLKAWYGIDKPMDMPMAGMDRMMQALRGFSGADFEQAWLQMMVHHHMGAVDMSALARGRATHPELLQLAQSIITAQGKEIEQLRGWAQAWYGFDPMPSGHGGHGGMPTPGLPNTGGGGALWQNAALSAAMAALAAALLALPLGLLLRRRLARNPR